MCGVVVEEASYEDGVHGFEPMDCVATRLATGWWVSLKKIFSIYFAI
jgi:hypothetical protein